MLKSGNVVRHEIFVAPLLGRSPQEASAGRLAAFPFGTTRSADPYRQANVSYSLLQRQDGQIVRHTLIDVGMGIVPSLLEFEVSHGVHVVNEVLITPPHFDHFAQLDWLSMALLHNCRDDQPRPLPIYATADCWEAGPNAMFRYLAEGSDFRPIQSGSPIAPGGRASNAIRR